LPVVTYGASDGDVSVQTNPKSFADLQKIRRDFRQRIQRLKANDPKNRSKMEDRKLPWEEELVYVAYLDWK